MCDKKTLNAGTCECTRWSDLCQRKASAQNSSPAPLPRPFVMAASSGGIDDVRSALLVFSRVAKSLVNHEERQVQQLVEVLKHHMRQKVFALLRGACGEAVLYTYSADATPLRCTSTTVLAAAGGQVVRKGRNLEELLLQRGLFKTIAPGGEPCMAFLFTDILSLSEGKKAGNVFTAQAKFFPLLRKAGHDGICVQHVCADRALFSPLERLLRQRVEAYYSAGIGPDLGEGRRLLALTDWVVGTGCCAHDVQNSLKWALGGVASPQDVQDLHIVIEALRNSFSILLERLPEFLTKHIAFCNSESLELVECFWRQLGVEADMVEEVAAVNPWFRDGSLYVSQEMADQPDCLERVSRVMLYLCRWRKFSDSRWCTVGTSCRSLLWGLCVGLEAWVAMARADPSASDFYLHGFSKLSPAIKHYCVVASMVAYVPDVLLTEILVDDRVARRAARLQEAVSEEIFWLEGVGAFTWQRLAKVLGGVQEAWELRHAVVRGAHVAAAFMHRKVFSQMSEYPWKLCVGNVAANLDALAASEEPIRDSCAHKVRSLLKLGFNKDKLISAVQLLREVPWSSVPVEQAHASAAVLHRFHPEYGVGVLATRATLHQCRHFWLEPPEVTKEARQATKIKNLTRKAPEKASGKHAFLAHLMESAKATLPANAKLSQATVRQIVKEHNRLFQSLPPAGQAAFHREALQTSQRRSAEVQEELQHLQTAARLGESRLTAERLEEGLLNRVPLARFSEADYSSMQQLLATPDFGWPAVAQRRQELAKGPEAPPADVLEAFQKCPIYAAPLLESDSPEWLKRLCWTRAAVQERSVAFTDSLEEGALAYYFVYATQSPLEAVFKPMALKNPAVPCLKGASLEERLGAWSEWNYTFEAEEKEYVTGARLPFASGEGVVVLQNLTFESPGVLATNAYPVALQCFLDLLPPKPKEPKRKPTQESKASKVVPEGHLAQHPWLAEFATPESAEGSQSSHTQGARPELAEESAVDQDAVLDKVWEGMAEKRQEWELQGVPAGVDFTVDVTDWAWTRGQAGKAYYCASGSAAKGDPTAWCRRYQLTPQTSFSAKLYGEKVASGLATEWCRRLQFYYDLYKAQPSREFAYTKAHKDALPASEAFAQLQSELEKGSKAEKRAQAIESLFPSRK